MKEFITKENRLKLSGKPFESRKGTFPNPNPSRTMAAENDGAYLVRPGPFPTLAAIENVLQKNKLLTDLKKTVFSENSFEYKVLERLYTNRPSTVSKLMKKYSDVGSTSLDETF